ncbi:MAG: leucine-rich repeat domain-containing protein, partial [Salinivirgaceae bacterium]|nr:leucine-rich repeat domain-containing protein [Salinivirgaceae bacterium]
MTITIPEPVTRIGEGAFEYCTNLRSVTISNSVTSIGATAFRNCSGLTSVTIPESVTSIGNSAFEYCSGLTTVTIPNSVTTIGINAFSNCSGLTTVTIPNSLTSIDRSVFAQCSRLTTVTIPSSVKTIGSYAFYQCNGLRSICFEGSIQPTYAKNTSFSDVAKSIRVCVPTDYTPNSWCGFTNLIKGHNKITDAAVAATCTETGLTEGSHCSYCGNVIVAQEVIAALGHNYGTPTYTWSADGKSCSAKAVCSRNSSHIVTEDASISSTVATAATCESKGKTKYTATFTNSRFATQTKTVTDIAALGHNYGTPTYTWSTDGKSCSAKVVCSRNSSHIVTENASISSAVATAATCETKGKTK